MHHDAVFDFLRIDVHPTTDDHETFAVGEVQKTVVVDVADITELGPQRMIGMLRRRGLAGDGICGGRGEAAGWADSDS